MRRRACGRLCFPRHASGPLSIGKTRRCTCSRWKPGCARPAGRWVPLPCGGCNLPGAGRCGSVRRCCGFGGRTCGKLKRGSNRSSCRQCWRSAERRTLEPAGGVSCADFGIRWFGWDTRHGRMSWRISKGGLSGWYLSGGGRPGYPPASGGIRRDRGAILVEEAVAKRRVRLVCEWRGKQPMSPALRSQPGTAWIRLHQSEEQAAADYLEQRAVGGSVLPL